MAGLGDVIAATFAGWQPLLEGSLHLERSIYDTADPEQIARTVDAFCRARLGAGIAAYEFYDSVQGSVSGLRLADGRRVVVKAHPPTRSVAFLTAVHRVQRYLARRGFPCPRPILGPKPLGHGQAVVDELVDEGIYRDAHDPAVRRTLAETLAQLLRLTRELRGLQGLEFGGLQRHPPDALWPAPHSKIFDFEATAPGAEWIDRLAREAWQTLLRSDSPLLIGHTDWSVKHFRFVGDSIRVIYDWDSLKLDKEALIVGGAAATFTMTWHLDVPPMPSTEEASAFVAAYEAVRGTALTPADWDAISAAVTYTWAYAARCEHSRDQHVSDFTAGSLRSHLALYGRSRLRA